CSNSSCSGPKSTPGHRSRGRSRTRKWSTTPRWSSTPARLAASPSASAAAPASASRVSTPAKSPDRRAASDRAAPAAASTPAARALMTASRSDARVLAVDGLAVARGHDLESGGPQHRLQEPAERAVLGADVLGQVLARVAGSGVGGGGAQDALDEG